MDSILKTSPFTPKALWSRALAFSDAAIVGVYAYASAAINSEGYSFFDLSIDWVEATLPYVSGSPALLGVEYGVDGAAWIVRKQIPLAREIASPYVEGAHETTQWTWRIPVFGPQVRVTLDWPFNGAAMFSVVGDLVP